MARHYGDFVMAAASMTSRLALLREKIVGKPPSISSKRAKLYTDGMRKFEFEPMIIRHAKSLAHVLQNIPVVIFPGELVVGTPVERVPGALLYPEGIGNRVIAEVDGLRTRAPGSFAVSDEDVKILQDDVMPYWVDRSMQAWAEKGVPKKVLDALYGAAAAPFILTEMAGYGHVSINYPKLLSTGFGKIAEDAQAKITEYDTGMLRDPDAPNKVLFYQAAQIVAEAFIAFLQRYASLAVDMAAAELKTERRTELEQIAENCRVIATEPPKTFHQALQFVRFVHLILTLETYDGQAISVGRIDQYLLQFYEKDVQAGILNRDQARELVECLWVKIHDSVPVFDSMVNLFFGGLLNTQNVTIGGVNEAGNDATNELTYLMLEATQNVALPLPNVHVRVHANAPLQMWQKLAEVIASGENNVGTFNDAVVIKALTRKGIPLAEARNYATVGCVEIAPFGTSLTSSDAALFNLGLCLELALNNGKSRVLGTRLGPRTGDAQDFKSLDDVLQAFRTQVAHFVQLMVAGANAFEVINMHLKPTPFLSLCVDDCFAAGKDVTAGSARYNFTGVQGVGMADVADSLATIEQLVFQEKKVTLAELLEALHSNFSHHPTLHKIILNKVAKYGEDDAIADRYAQLIARIYSDEVEKHRNARGGWYIPGMYSVTTHVPFGNLTGALPSGRLYGEPLSNGASPSPLSGRKGVTAALRSAAKVEWERYTNGIAFTITLDPTLVAKVEGLNVLGALLRAYVEMGGLQIQFNIVGEETLRAAQAHPESYPQMLVRVAGYSAYFTSLGSDIQDLVIRQYQKTI